MKIAILTHQLGNNYGGLLQNFALQEVLKNLGHTPITLNYKTKTPLKIKILSFCSRLIKRLRGQNIPLRAWPNKIEQDIISQNTKRFVENHIKTTKEVGFNELASLKNESFNAIVVGSDQVWRGDRYHVERYFLKDFVDLDVPKISYAASFGIDTWNYPPKVALECKELVKQFRAISVREESAINLCCEHLNMQASLVLDPTLLIDPDIYVNLLKKANMQHIGKGKMMVYVLDKAKYKQDIENVLAKKLELEPYSVMAACYFGQSGSTSISDCIFPSVEEWLQGFIESDFVVTDSFHGTVFSIIFNKPFIAIANAKRGTSRFTSLLKIVQLEARLVNNLDEALNIVDKPIDYSKVKILLEKKQKESYSFIKTNLR